MGEATILVVEDDRGIRESLSVALEAEGHRVVTLEDGRDIDDHLPHTDLAVIDLGLPAGPDGLALTRHIREHFEDMPLIILTAAGDLEHKGAGYHAGADHYVAKPFSVTELLWQITALLRRVKPRPRVARAGKLTVELDAHIARYDGTPLPLTLTEFGLLRALVSHAGEAMGKSRLLGIVWGHEHYDANLVETNIKRLRAKLASHDPALIETVRGVGYRLRT